jgi:SAM-dependent methyltransferase
MVKTQWSEQARTWAVSCQPPQRPIEEELAFVRSQVPPSSNVVILGVTPELTGMYAQVTAIDSDPSMIHYVWEGDSATKRAIEGDWRSVDLQGMEYDAVIGDGSLSVLGGAGKAQEVIHKAMRWLNHGGKIVIRMYVRPEVPVQIEDIHCSIDGHVHSMKHIRRLIALYLAERQNGVVSDKDRFKFLGQILGQELPTKSDAIVWLPRKQEVMNLFGGELKVVGSYPMAECFPYLILRKE